MNLLQVFSSVFPVVAALVVFAVVAFVLTLSIPLGNFMAFIAAFTQFNVGTLMLINSFTGVMQTVPLYERMRPILQSLPEVDESGELSFNDAVEETERIFLEAVKLRLHADVPVGALLSGVWFMWSV